MEKCNRQLLCHGIFHHLFFLSCFHVKIILMAKCQDQLFCKAKAAQIFQFSPLVCNTHTCMSVIEQTDWKSTCSIMVGIGWLLMAKCLFCISWMGSNLIVLLRDRRFISWWHYQMEAFSALLALCVGKSPVAGEFPSQRASSADVSLIWVRIICESVKTTPM